MKSQSVSMFRSPKSHLMLLFAGAAFAAVAVTACATEQPDTTDGAFETLVTDYGDAFVLGVQFPNGDSVSKVFSADENSIPVATWQFHAGAGTATWEVRGNVGLVDGAPLFEDIGESNWMAYTLFAGVEGKELPDSAYRCTCGVECSVSDGGWKCSVSCKWKF